MDQKGQRAEREENAGNKQSLKVLINGEKEETTNEINEKCQQQQAYKEQGIKIDKLQQISNYLDRVCSLDQNPVQELTLLSEQELSRYLDTIIAQNEKAIQQCDCLQKYLDDIQHELNPSQK